MASLYGDMIFNIDHGYLEGLVRGFRSGILTRTDYLNLIQCETLEGKGFLLHYWEVFFHNFEIFFKNFLCFLFENE